MISILPASFMYPATGTRSASRCCFMKEASGTSGLSITQNRRRTELFLHFGACNYFASAYLNGEELGEHEGGFTPFDFEITDRVKPHGNFLVLRVNNTRGKDQVPTVNTDWWNYGGITRPVTLVEVPETFVQNYSVQLEKGSTTPNRGLGSTERPKASAELSQSAFQKRGLARHSQTNSMGRAEFSFSAGLTALVSRESQTLHG